MHGAFSLGNFRRAAARRLPRHLSARDIAKLLALLRGDRPDREFPHDHLCVRPADLFAVARRLSTAVPVGHARHAQDAAHGAVSPAPASGFAVMLAVWFALRRGSGGATIGGDAAQHGGVRRDDLVRDAGCVVHPAAQAACRTSSGRTAARSAVPGAVRDHRDRAGHAVLPVAGSGVSDGVYRRRSVVSCSACCTSRSSAGTSWCCRPKKSSR